MSLTVSELWVYPVKSCGGVSVEQAIMTPTGFRFDRNWVVVNSKGRFQSQRQWPSMTLIHADITPRALLGEEDLEPGAHPDAALVLSAPGMPDLSVPLLPSNPSPPTTDVSVWAWKGKGRDEGDEAAAWLSKFMGNDVRLVRYAGDPSSVASTADADPTRRPVGTEWLAEGASDEVAFPDAFPYLLANASSLDDLNAQLPAGEGPIKMNRFRPNIVIRGAAAWAEDTWMRLAVGGARLALPKPCDRCAVPTVDQETGERGDEPRPTLTRLRSGAVLGWADAVPEFKNAIFFGWNAVEEQRAPTLAVGEPVTVLETRDTPAVPRATKAADSEPARPRPPPNFAPPPPAEQRAAQEAIEARRDPARLSTLQKMGLMLILLFARMIIAHWVSKKKED